MYCRRPSLFFSAQPIPISTATPDVWEMVWGRGWPTAMGALFVRCARKEFARDQPFRRIAPLLVDDHNCMM